MISSKQIAKSVYKIIQDHQTNDQSGQQFSDEKIVDALIEYLTENQLTNLLPKIIEHLERLEDENAQHNTLLLETADEIDEKIFEQILQKFNNPAKTNHQKEPELIGGFVATYKGFIYDASIKNQIKLLRNKLIAK